MSDYQLIHLSKYSNNKLFSTVNVEEFYLDMYDIKHRYPNKTVLLIHIFENLEFTSYNSIAIECFRTILQRIDIKYYFVLDGAYKNEHQLINPECITTLNWGMMYTYHHVHDNKHPVSNEYNPKNGKGLFLCGKADKPHRIGLLKRFYETDSLNNLVWSFYNPTGTVASIRENYFSEYSDEQYEHFLYETVRTLDYKPEFPDHPLATFSHYGFPYDVKLYEDTAFSIVSETWSQGKQYLFTEKIWKAIVNKHPFIMVGPVNNIIMLQNMGFRTFENYLKVKDYHQREELEDRLDDVVINAVDFRNQLEDQNTVLREKIKQDVDYNFDRFMQLARKDINDFLSAVQAPYSLIASIIEHHVEIQQYNRETGHY